MKGGYGSLAEVYEKWTILDLFDVNCAMTAIEFAEARARAEAERR